MASMNNKDDDDGDDDDDDAAIPYRPLPPILIGSECYANNVKRQNDDKELIREQQGNNNIAHHPLPFENYARPESKIFTKSALRLFKHHSQ
ncbi:hypothetical protein E4U13_006607 [Claviceps humidiphila]|uniref:Uncharacterized protein n=1 Tax=Claviceps humidiphila TaxID=1294629 RepID=A0A9P7TWT1_9HYPO|nr:hypothetical protein E4U13_006607 [Claviceps humidiphila]